MKTIISLLALSTSLIACTDPGVGSSNEDILGGTADVVDLSVVQLRYHPDWQHIAQCTATVIGPTTLLTAAHCAPVGAYGYQYNASDTADWTANGPGWIDALYAVQSPSYDGSPADGHDVAVVNLITPTTLAPMALGSAPAVGTDVIASGYGLDGFGTGASGTRNMVTMTVEGLASGEFTAGVDGQGTCHGDSGGPVFQNGAIVGTTSYGDTADCHNSDHFMRVDDNLDFLDQYIGSSSGGGGGGSSCSTSVGLNGLTESVSCVDGTCTCSLNGQQIGTCTASDASTACSIPGDCCGF